MSSRLKNLARLPSKRDSQGIGHVGNGRHKDLEQLLRRGTCAAGCSMPSNVSLAVAQEKSLEAVFHDYEIDSLDAVPADMVFQTTSFGRVASRGSWHS